MKHEKQAVTQICPLCDRPIPKGAPQSRHHLIPKLKGGKGGDIVLLHHQYHKEIHARISESELATIFSTPEALKTHPDLAQFIAWIRKRPPNFLSRTIRKRTLSYNKKQASESIS